ncbi:MAG: hypothetical protein IJH09_00050 [Clostridia bacterium]|nr:hypothetical protein [Clostridia bacterium]
MMYGYMTLSDETGIAHSEMKPDGTVKVCFEKPVEGGFHSATCYLPAYRWENIAGFSESDIARLEKILRDNAHLILEFSQEGGFANAAGY